MIKNNIISILLFLLFLIPMGCGKGMKELIDNDIPQNLNIVCNGDYLITNENEIGNINDCNIIDGNLEVNSFDGCSSLNFLSNLIYITGDLIIFDNINLINLDGLEKLDTVDGELQIHSNSYLNNLSGLSQLTTVKGNFEIQSNIVLPTCEATNLLDQLLNFNGVNTISDNDNNGTCE